MTKKKTKTTKTAGFSYSDLEKLEKTEARPSNRPPTLPLSEIYIAPRVFQRRPLLDHIERERKDLVSDLMTSLRRGAPPVPPILVTAVGRRFFVVDGHHRREAYRLVEWKRGVPVEYCEDDLKNARLRSITANIGNHLPTSQTAKSEIAWRLLLEGHQRKDLALTWERIMATACVSRATVGRMSKRLGELGDKAKTLSWQEAMREERDEKIAGDPGWREKKALAMAEYFRRGPNLTQDPEITARALMIVSEQLPPDLLEQWGLSAVERMLDDLSFGFPEETETMRKIWERITSPYAKARQALWAEEQEALDESL